MTLEYAIGNKTGGANPFKIFSELSTLDADALAFALKRMSYDQFLKSAYWFAVSMTAKSRAGMRCQVCNNGREIAVHHRTYDMHGREHLNMIDLVVLCGDCHGLFHGHKVIEYQPPKLRIEPRAKISQKLVLPHSESDIQMPDGDSFCLTKELINRCRANGSFTNATLRAFGLKKENMISGWAIRLEGKTIPREQYRQALEGRFIYRCKLE